MHHPRTKGSRPPVTFSSCTLFTLTQRGRGWRPQSHTQHRRSSPAPPAPLRPGSRGSGAALERALVSGEPGLKQRAPLENRLERWAEGPGCPGRSHEEPGHGRWWRPAWWGGPDIPKGPALVPEGMNAGHRVRGAAVLACAGSPVTAEGGCGVGSLWKSWQMKQREPDPLGHSTQARGPRGGARGDPMPAIAARRVKPGA